MLARLKGHGNLAGMKLPASLQNAGEFVVVLVRPKGARNVGSISRAMGHFGVRRLRLVSPHCDVKSLEARSMAMSGQDILAGAEHFATLREATADCGWLVAASCRRGRNRRSTIEPRADAPLLLRRAAETRLALIFGPEDKGLRTDEVDLCQERLWIPALPGDESFNISQAALIVLWEIFMAWEADAGPPARPAGNPQRAEIPIRGNVEEALDHLRSTLDAIGYFPHHNPERVIRILRRFLDRAQPDEREIKMLRGALSQLEWKILTRPEGGEAPASPPADSKISSL